MSEDDFALRLQFGGVVVSLRCRGGPGGVRLGSRRSGGPSVFGGVRLGVRRESTGESRPEAAQTQHRIGCSVDAPPLRLAAEREDGGDDGAQCEVFHGRAGGKPWSRRSGRRGGGGGEVGRPGA